MITPFYMWRSSQRKFVLTERGVLSEHTPASVWPHGSMRGRGPLRRMPHWGPGDRCHRQSLLQGLWRLDSIIFFISWCTCYPRACSPLFWSSLYDTNLILFMHKDSSTLENSDLGLCLSAVNFLTSTSTLFHLWFHWKATSFTQSPCFPCYRQGHKGIIFSSLFLWFWLVHIYGI